MNDRRLAALGIVWLLCAAWAVLGVALVLTAYTTPVGMDGTGGSLLLFAVVGVLILLTAVSALVAGVRAIRREDAATSRRRTPAVASVVGSAGSALVGAWFAAYLPVVAALLMFQAVALLGLAALVRPVRAT